MNIGIDLGTSYSAVAWVNKKGEAEILENREGERLTPSVVYFQENGDVIVGSVAKQKSLIHPERVITNVKDHMGSDYTYEIDGQTYRPQDISALILKKLLQDAEARTEEKVDKAVITIPAYYSDAQREATLEAAALAGLKGRQVLTEPTAAAVAYSHSGKLDKGKVLVYDLGGGTFDVSIIQQNGVHVKVLATGGFSELGGHFFDTTIMNHISDRLLEEDSIDLETDDTMIFVRQDLALKTEIAKKQLSSTDRADILLHVAGVPKQFTLSRGMYEEMIAPFIQRTEAKVRQVMEEAGITFDDLEQILLVGGSSRTPLIQQKLEKFSGKKPSRTVNQDEAVALGAALCAGGARYIQDVCSRSIGLISYDYAMERELFSKIISNNSILPAKGKQTFGVARTTKHLVLKVAEQDEQDENWELLQAYDIVLDNKNTDTGYAHPLDKVTVEMELDENQILHMTVSCTGTVEFTQEFRLDRAEDPELRERRSRAALIAGATVI